MSGARSCAGCGRWGSRPSRWFATPKPARRKLPSGTPLRIADYEDSQALRRAFAGADQIILVSSDGDARAVMRHHANAIAAAAEAGPSRIIFMSIVDIDPGSPFYYAPVYRDAERRLAASGVPSTILRCGLYSDFILDHWLKARCRIGRGSFACRPRTGGAHLAGGCCDRHRGHRLSAWNARPKLCRHRASSADPG